MSAHAKSLCRRFTPGHLAAHEDARFSGHCGAGHGDCRGPHLPPRHHALVFASRLRLLGQHLRDRHRNRRAARPRYALSPQQRAHRRHPEIDLRGELSRHVRQQYRTHRLFAGGRHRHNRAPPLPCARALLDTPWRLLLCALLFPLVMFSAKLTHSYFLGMSGTHLADGRSLRHPERRGACPCRRRRKLDLAAPLASRRAYLACSPTAPPSTCSSCS